MSVLKVFSRAECHLCHEFLAELAQACAGHAVDIQVIDIDSDPEYIRRYALKIPVLVGEDGEICHYTLDREAVEEYLA